MSKLIALFAIVLILSGVLLLAVPREEASGTRSAAPEAIAIPSVLVTARDIAEQVQAPCPSCSASSASIGTARTI